MFTVEPIKIAMNKDGEIKNPTTDHLVQERKTLSRQRTINFTLS